MPGLEAAVCASESKTLVGDVGAALARLLAGCFFFALAAMSSPALAATPQGVWLTEDKDAALTITNCGDKLCGRILWLASATNRSGSLRLDQNNPDPAKQTQPICGLVVIRDLKPSGPDTWEGYVYNPQDGKTYSGTSPFCQTTHCNFGPM